MKIIDKKIENKYEAGSGSLYIPILGDIFPKLFGQQMKEIEIFFIITKDKKYEVDKELYDKLNIGDKFKP